MTTAPRYAIADLPPGRVYVRVGWEARVFMAARLQDDKKRWRWGTRTAGEVTWLPPRGRAGRGWSPEPEWWQPPDAATWGLPLPTPLPEQVAPQFLSQSGSRKWRAMAEQAAHADRLRDEIAAEVAAETVLQAALDDEIGELPSLTYSPPGRITPAEAVARLTRALLTDGTGPHGGHYALGAGRAESNQTAETKHGLDRFEPTRADLRDYPVAMAWFAALDPPQLRPRSAAPFAYNFDQRLLIHQAQGRSLRSIARAEKLSHAETAARALGHAVTRLTRAANNLPVFEYVAVVDPIAALRARNRLHRRQTA